MYKPRILLGLSLFPDEFQEAHNFRDDQNRVETFALSPSDVGNPQAALHRPWNMYTYSYTVA